MTAAQMRVLLAEDRQRPDRRGELGAQRLVADHRVHGRRHEGDSHRLRCAPAQRLPEKEERVEAAIERRLDARLGVMSPRVDNRVGQLCITF
jgi:hypothetical protein